MKAAGVLSGLATAALVAAAPAQADANSYLDYLASHHINTPPHSPPLLVRGAARLSAASRWHDTRADSAGNAVSARCAGHDRRSTAGALPRHAAVTFGAGPPNHPRRQRWRA